MDNITSPSVDRPSFSSRFKQLLYENNMSLSAVAEVVHLSKSTISRYAKGSMSPKITVIEKLAEFFGVSPSWLMGLDCPKTPNNELIKKELLQTFDNLSCEGQKEALKQVQLISLIPKYTK